MRSFRRKTTCKLFLVSAVLLAAQWSWCADAPASKEPPEPEPSLWEGKAPSLFQKGANELSLSLGAGIGMPIFGSEGHHDWALGMLEYGWMLSDVVGEDHWYRGNWELVANLFGGFEYSPEVAYFTGVAPMLRYNFVTGSRFVPFFGLGAGVSATDIRGPDLSTTFEFNLQAGPGVRYFIADHAALTLQYRFIHLSNAGMDTPNLGVNSSTFLLGMTWVF